MKSLKNQMMQRVAEKAVDQAMKNPEQMAKLASNAMH